MVVIQVLGCFEFIAVLLVYLFLLFHAVLASHMFGCWYLFGVFVEILLLIVFGACCHMT